MTPADVLDDAADLIERDGWWNGTRHDGTQVCAITALMAACAECDYMPARQFLASYIGTDEVATWNDAQDGSDKVVWTMRQVAADLREVGG